MKALLLGDVCPCKKGVDLFRTDDPEAVFGDTLSLFSKRDFIVANLECAITDSEEKIKKFGPALKAPRETASVLSKVGVDLVGLSNNHVFDYGVRGALDTLAALDSVGIAYTGFGKNYEQNLEVLNKLKVLQTLELPVLLGVSRKSVIGYTLDLPVENRLNGTLALTAYGMLQGCSFIRVHDIRSNKEVIRMLEAVNSVSE